MGRYPKNYEYTFNSEFRVNSMHYFFIYLLILKLITILYFGLFIMHSDMYFVLQTENHNQYLYIKYVSITTCYIRS